MSSNITPARAQALAKLGRHLVVRSGMGMWDDEVPAVSPAAAEWLVAQGYAERKKKELGITDAGFRAVRALELDRG